MSSIEKKFSSEIRHPPLADVIILKSRYSFLITRDNGNFDANLHDTTGLYKDDMRILSAWNFGFPNGALKLLSHHMGDSNLKLTAMMSNRRFHDKNDIFVDGDLIAFKRQQFMFEEILHEKLSIHNYSDEKIVFDIQFHYHADFKDLFEVRGVDRQTPPGGFSSQQNEKHVRLSYHGQDKIDRNTFIYYSEKPVRAEPELLTFRVFLPPKGDWELTNIIAPCEVEDNARDFDKRFEQAITYAQTMEKHWNPIQTDDPEFAAFLSSSQRAVSILTTQLETGFFPFAGVPWFNVPFGRDSLITAMQILPFNEKIAEGVLRFLAENQATKTDTVIEAEPGKILHEMRRNELSNIGEVAFKKYYGSVDSTPLFLMLAGRYYQKTSNINFITKLMKNFEAAEAWIDNKIAEGDNGFLQYISNNDKGLSTQGWKDSWDSVFHENGELGKPPIAFCEVQGYAYDAYLQIAELYKATNQNEKAKKARKKAEVIYERFNNRFWDEDLGCYIIAIAADNNPCRVKSSNIGHLLFTNIVPEERAASQIKLLLSDEFYTGWGIRTIAKNESRYNPLSYHNGTVWPHDTGIAAAGFAQYGAYEEAAFILKSLYRMSKYSDRGFLPELVCGFPRQYGERYINYPTACLPQAWASGATFMALAAAYGWDGKNKFLYDNANKSYVTDFGTVSF